MVTSSRILTLLLLPVTVVTLHAQNDTYAPTKIAQMDAAAYLAPLPANGVVPLNVIASDFATNAPAAIGKYSNQRITVIGRISALSQSSSENKVLVVTMQDAGANLPAVKADFLYGSIPQNSEIQVSSDGTQAFLVRRDRTGNILGQDPYLSVDQRVGIKGDFKEQKVSDIVLTACKLIPKSKLHELSGGR
jgi:hypothetical protein